MQIRKRSCGKPDLRASSINKLFHAFAIVTFVFFETEKLAWFLCERFLFFLIGIFIIITFSRLFSAEEFDKQLFSFGIVFSLILGIPEEVFSLFL